MDRSSWEDLYQSLFLFWVTRVFSLEETSKMHGASHAGRSSLGVLATLGKDGVHHRVCSSFFIGKMRSDAPGDSRRGWGFPFEGGRSGRSTIGEKSYRKVYRQAIERGGDGTAGNQEEEKLAVGCVDCLGPQLGWGRLARAASLMRSLCGPQEINPAQPWAFFPRTFPLPGCKGEKAKHELTRCHAAL